MFRNTAVLCVMLLVGMLASRVAGQDESAFFVLNRVSDGFTVEAVALARDEVKVVQFVGAEDVDGPIDIIFPPSAGQSASLVTPGSATMAIVRNTGEELQVELREADGSKRALPARAIADLVRYDIRVNVTGGDRRAAFLIEGNETVHGDVGPVANMFAGRIPATALAGAYVVQTETYARDAGEPISGRAELLVDRWPIVTVTLPDGTQADFIVDIGAGTTVMDKSILPEGIEIEAAAVIEYSSEGRRELKYAPGGATGAVQSIVGHAALDHVMLGDLQIPAVTVDVMEGFPDMFGRPIGGILGLDVMRRCEELVLTLGGESPSLQFDSADTPEEEAIELPFAFVSSHICIEGDVNGTQVFFVLDTGAPSSFLDESAAQAARVQADASKAVEGRGLDDGRVSIAPGIIDTLTLDGHVFESVHCRISALAAFDKIRGPDQYVGLLGNDFFAKFSRIEIDFTTRTVRFVL